MKKFLNSLGAFLFWVLRVTGRLIWTLHAPIRWAEPYTIRFEQRFHSLLGMGAFTLTFLIIFLFLFLALVRPAVESLDKIRSENGYSWSTYGKIVLSSIIAPNPARPMNKLQKDLIFLLSGIPEGRREFLLEVATCESGDIPAAIQQNPGSVDRGYLQINSKYWGWLYENRRYPQGEAFAPIISVEHANIVLDRQGQEAWVCYRKKQELAGSSQKNLPLPKQKPPPPQSPDTDQPRVVKLAGN